MSGVRSVVWTPDNHRTWFPVYLVHYAPSSPLRFTTLTNKQVHSSKSKNSLTSWRVPWHVPLSLFDYMVCLTSRLDSKWRWHYPGDLYLPVCPDPGSAAQHLPYPRSARTLETVRAHRQTWASAHKTVVSELHEPCHPASPPPTPGMIGVSITGRGWYVSTWIHPLLPRCVLYQQPFHTWTKQKIKPAVQFDSSNQAVDDC